MNSALPPNAAAPEDRYAEALRLNKDALENDLSATTRTYQETIQLQQDAQISLLDRIALLEARLKNSEQETARAMSDLEASRVAKAAIVRQTESQQEELAQLRPNDALLRQLLTLYMELEAMGNEAWPDLESIYTYDLGTPERIDRMKELAREQRRWEPLLAEFKRIKPLIKSASPSGNSPAGQAGVNPSNPIPIPRKEKR